MCRCLIRRDATLLLRLAQSIVTMELRAECLGTV